MNEIDSAIEAMRHRTTDDGHIATVQRMRFALQAVERTLSAHGHIDANTPLYDVVRAAVVESSAG